MSEFWKPRRVVVAGGAGFIGTAVCRALAQRGCAEILVPRSRDYDLVTQKGTFRMYSEMHPDLVIDLAGVGGGIVAHGEHSGLHYYANLAMAMNIIEQGRKHGIEKIVYVSSADAYPCNAALPLREDDLWEGRPHDVHLSYGLAKRSVHAMLESYLREYGLQSAYVIPTNVFGPGANFDPATSHVVSAMIRRFREARVKKAREVVCWGSGSATRDFIFVDDVAEGILLAAEKLGQPEPINLGSGREVSIRELALSVARIIGFTGSIHWDSAKPEGQSRRCLDTSRALRVLGFSAPTDLEAGLRATIDWWERSVVT